MIKSLAWPGLLLICISLVVFGESIDQRILFFNIAYVFLGLSLFLLERTQPHRNDWNKSDGQVWNDLGHTLLSKGGAQIIIVNILSLGILDAQAGTFWPSSWHFSAQVLLGLVVAEFGLYWAHRLAHEFHFLWRFHSIHHSVEKLWFWNTGRFHFMDAIFKIGFSLTALWLVGAPLAVLLWYGMITAFIGLLTHCNVEMHCGPLNYIFSTPVAHRWHHAPTAEEGNTNYGENLLLWDHIFRSFYLPTTDSPVKIGTKTLVPSGFWQQLSCPFKKNFIFEIPQTMDVSENAAAQAHYFNTQSPKSDKNSSPGVSVDL